VTPVLYALVEGDDDQRFFERVVAPRLEAQGRALVVVQYSHWSSKKLREMIASLAAMASCMTVDFVYVADLSRAPCVTARKDKITSKFGTTIPVDRIVVVTEEIESWYLAGVRVKTAKVLGIREEIGATESITKEQFDRMRPGRSSRVDLLQEMLNRYDLNLAQQRNSSFGYFVGKWMPANDCGKHRTER
jgi:hypothetical protein